MEKFAQSFASRPLNWPSPATWSLAGVVGSGNLEVLMEPDPAHADAVDFAVETSIPGYRESWLAALQDFADHYAVGGVRVTVHDQGAPPVVIKLRLRQALDQILKVQS